MSTRIPAHRLTTDHHGLHITVDRIGRPQRRGRLTDTLIGETDVEIWIDDVRLLLPGVTPVVLREPSVEQHREHVRETTSRSARGSRRRSG